MMATMSPLRGRGILKPVHGAGQRLGERGVLQRHILRNDESVLRDDARGNLDELRIGAVVEDQIVAKILLAAQAEVALAAGRGVERDDAIAGSEIGDALAGFDDGSGQLVAEERGRNDHARVISAAKDFEIGAAGESRANADDELAGCGLGNGNLLDADIFAAVKDGGAHGDAPVKKRVLDCFAAMVDNGFDRLAAFDDQPTRPYSGPASTTVSTVFRPPSTTFSTFLRPSSTTVLTVLRPRRIASFTVLAISSSISLTLLRPPAQAPS